LKYFWNTGATSKGISVDKEGVYNLKIKDDKNCLSKSTSFEVFVKSIPPIPDVNIEGAFQLSALSKSAFFKSVF